jgi:hypothetical protein
MNLLADEGIDKPIVDALRNAGFDVVYIVETNLGASDEFIYHSQMQKKEL